MAQYNAKVVKPDPDTLILTGATVTGMMLGSFTGKNLAGACTLTGAKVGDKVLGVAGATAGVVGFKASSFESTITVADQIQQTAAADLSSNLYTVLLISVS